MPLPLLVALPLLAYAAYALVRRLAGAPLSRRALHVHASLLLAIYFVATAAAGVFWVANQQLPPFDLHYLLGYLTTALVVLHLALTAPSVIAYYTKPTKPEPATSRTSQRRWLELSLAALLAAAAFALGTRHGSTSLVAHGAGRVGPSLEAIELYHAWSSHGRASVLSRAPSVSWGTPARYLVREGTLLSLPAPSPSAPAVSSLDLPTLSTLLHAGAGITERRGGLDLRAAASSGALFPTELYVVQRVAGAVASGVHHYAPERHALVQLPPGVRSLDDLGLPLAGDAPGATSYLVAASVFRRSGQKYRDRAYRYAVADAGHVLANLIVAAEQLGLRAEPLAAFDESRIAEALAIDEAEQGVLAVLALRAAPPGATTTRRSAPRFAPAPMPDASATPLGATGFAHLATSLRLAPGSAALRSLLTPAGEPLALPASAAADLSPLAAIAQRRSRRSFRPEALALAQLAAMLDATSPRAARLSESLHTVALVDRVEGLAPGSYHYDPAARGLRLLRAARVVPQAGSAALGQDVIAKAPVVILLAIDREALAGEGARGYRHALLEAGITGGRVYLEAERRGLGACSVGAFYDEELAEAAGLDPAKWWPVQLSAVGVPSD